MPLLGSIQQGPMELNVGLAKQSHVTAPEAEVSDKPKLNRSQRITDARGGVAKCNRIKRMVLCHKSENCVALKLLCQVKFIPECIDVKVMG